MAREEVGYGDEPYHRAPIRPSRSASPENRAIVLRGVKETVVERAGMSQTRADAISSMEFSDMARDASRTSASAARDLSWTPLAPVATVVASSASVVEGFSRHQTAGHIERFESGLRERAAVVRDETRNRGVNEIRGRLKGALNAYADTLQKNAMVQRAEGNQAFVRAGVAIAGEQLQVAQNLVDLLPGADHLTGAFRDYGEGVIGANLEDAAAGVINSALGIEKPTEEELKEVNDNMQRKLEDHADHSAATIQRAFRAHRARGSRVRSAFDEYLSKNHVTASATGSAQKEHGSQIAAYFASRAKGSVAAPATGSAQKEHGSEIAAYFASRAKGSEGRQ